VKETLMTDERENAQSINCAIKAFLHDLMFNGFVVLALLYPHIQYCITS